MTSNKKLSLAAVALVVLGVGIGHGAAQWRSASLATARPEAPHSSAAASVSTGERRVLYWYDPMLPQQRFDKPGKSPFMDMQLVPKYADDAPVGGVAVDPRVAQTLGVRTATVTKQHLGILLQVPATVLLNERDVAIPQARTAGFVQRVARLAPGDVISAGALIAEVLVPEWAGAQQEFLAVRRTGDEALTSASRQRLLLMGMPMELVQRVERTGQVETVMAVHAPAGGLVQEVMVRQGMTVSAGMSLARITSLSTVWVEAALPEAQAGLARVGEQVEVALSAYPGKSLRGKVSAVLPETNAATRTLRVRADLANPGGRLRAGMFAQMRLGGSSEEALVVPTEAVIRTGQRAIVYVVDRPGRFSPVEVRVGRELADKLEVLQGLQPGQQVVVSGQFLIDSEASMQGVLQRQASSVAVAASAASAPWTPAAAVHEANATVVAVSGNEVTLNHEAVPALKWPAMEMAFPLGQAELAKGIQPGDKVRFTFREAKDGFEIVALQRVPKGGAR